VLKATSYVLNCKKKENKFLTKLQFTEIGLCKRFVKNTVDELAAMHECIRAMTTSFI